MYGILPGKIHKQFYKIISVIFVSLKYSERMYKQKKDVGKDLTCFMFFTKVFIIDAKEMRFFDKRRMNSII